MVSSIIKNAPSSASLFAIGFGSETLEFMSDNIADP